MKENKNLGTFVFVFLVAVVILTFIAITGQDKEESIFPITEAVALEQFQVEYIDIDFPCEGEELDENGTVVLEYEWASSLDYNAGINEYGY